MHRLTKFLFQPARAEERGTCVLRDGQDEAQIAGVRSIIRDSDWLLCDHRIRQRTAAQADQGADWWRESERSGHASTTRTKHVGAVPQRGSTESCLSTGACRFLLRHGGACTDQAGGGGVHTEALKRDRTKRRWILSARSLHRSWRDNHLHHRTHVLRGSCESVGKLATERYNWGSQLQGRKAGAWTRLAWDGDETVVAAHARPRQSLVNCID